MGGEDVTVSKPMTSEDIKHERERAEKSVFLSEATAKDRAAENEKKEQAMKKPKFDVPKVPVRRTAPATAAVGGASTAPVPERLSPLTNRKTSPAHPITQLLHGCSPGFCGFVRTWSFLQQYNIGSMGSKFKLVRQAPSTRIAPSVQRKHRQHCSSSSHGPARPWVWLNTLCNQPGKGSLSEFLSVVSKQQGAAVLSKTRARVRVDILLNQPDKGGLTQFLSKVGREPVLRHNSSLSTKPPANRGLKRVARTPLQKAQKPRGLCPS